LTSTVPIAPNWTFPVAAVIKSDSTTGKILVRAIPGAHVHDLVDARIGTLADNNLFAWDSTDSVWKNQTAAEAGLISTSDTGTVTNTMLAGSIANNKLTNSSVTVAGQTVALGGSTGVSLDNLSDVVITTPASDQVIKYNGTNWVNAASPGGGGGTVTSITAGTGLSASPSSPITTSGTLNVTDAALNPPGAIIMFGSATPPSGWLLCNGQSTTGYTALAAIVGATVPDLRNRFIVGAGSTYSQGATGGSTSHSHTLSNTGYAKGSRAGNRFVYEEVSPVPTWTAVNEISGTGAGTTTTRTFAIGLGGSTDNNTTYLPPYYALTYIIKT
jgi:microcystin-dependent protein